MVMYSRSVDIETRKRLLHFPPNFRLASTNRPSRCARLSMLYDRKPTFSGCRRSNDLELATEDITE